MAKTKKEKPLEGNFVDKKEFEDFKKSNEESLAKILDAIENKPSMVITTPVGSTTGTLVPASPLPSADPYTNGYLPIQYQTVFEKYFDPADGFTARLTFPEVNDKGQETGGINFTIFVPLKFSNTDDGYRKMYKQDLRTRALLPHNIAKGIEDWCKAVVNNLKYNRNIKTK